MHALARLAGLTLGPAALLALAAPARAQTIFLDDFESGLDGWVADSGCSYETTADFCGGQAPAWPTGQGAAYFANSTSCSYIGHWTGNLTLANPISIPNTTEEVVLRFWSYDAVECASCEWDWRFVYVSADGGSTWDFLGESTAFFEWKETTLDLSAYRGNDILLRFTFDSVDDQWNDFLGWIVDEVRVEYACPQPENYCTTSPNSAGAGAVMGATGPVSHSANGLSLTVTGAPPGQFGIFFYGPMTDTTPFGQGTMCVGGGTTGLIRLTPAAPIGPDGSLTRVLDLTAAPAAGDIGPGESRYFQFWYRDPGHGFNLSDGLHVYFCL